MPDRDASSPDGLTLPRELSGLVAALASRYVIEREVGRGGMATVYLARDVKHHRQVALKILNPELGAVLGVERFLSEIRVTANLQHPNLLPLFDSGDAEGLLYYVMPYVAGESLRSKLAREKQLPIEEAIHIAAAVASALDYAHRHGVIHRDLKPENILLHEGQPLIADFGIALAVSKAGGDRITQTGLSLGTPQYMSPEQATGDRIVDGRTDIYSLGAVTYEMLTGEAPHTGTTAQAIIARVLTDQVRSLRSSRPSVPEHVEDAVLRALEKLPADRWHTAHEFAAALTGEPATRGSAFPSLAFNRRGRRRSSRARAVLAVVPWAVAALALGAAGAGWLRTIPEARLSRFHMMLPDSAPITVQVWEPSLAFSPNGSRLVYKGPKNALFVKALDDFATRLIPGSEGSTCPSFSPDGAWILYQAYDGKLKKVLTEGGSPVVVTEGYCGTWTDRNEIVFTQDGGVYRMPAQGGSPQRVANSSNILSVSALPGGDAVLLGLYTGAVSSATTLAVLSLADGRIVPLGLDGNAPQYSRGHILFARQSDIFAAPFSLRTLRTTGPAVPVARDAVTSKFAVASFAVAGGTLGYLAGEPVAGRMYAVDLTGHERPLSAEILLLGWPRLSPDGERVALEVSSGRNTFDIWVYELRSRTLARVTNTRFSLRPTGWSADSRGIYYIAPDSTTFSAPRSVSWISWDRSEARRELLRFEAKGKEMEVASVGPDHGYMALSVSGGVWDIWIAPIDTPKAMRPFVATSALEGQPRFSADGKLLAYTSDETSRAEVYVQPVPGPGGRVQVSAGGGSEPVWDRAGHLYYRGPRRMMRATLATAPQLRLVQRDTLFEDIYDREQYAPFYDVMPGDKELLMLRSEARPRLAVVLNWPELLRRSGTSR